MALPIKLCDIKQEIVSMTDHTSSTTMLSGTIPGASVIHHCLSAGENMMFSGQRGFIRIFFLCSGEAAFASRGASYAYDEKSLFVDKPEIDVTISTHTAASLLEIRWDMNELDLQDLDGSTHPFPITLAYKNAEQYRDFFKSETTISRALIKQAIIPRFAFGSVEAKADDLVGQHAHPLLDQFFFSFEENDMDLLIDCRICPMKGNTLLHIPLGSNHGVLAKGDQRMHYLWIDCTLQEDKEAAVACLDEIHKPTGVFQTL